jgi:sensor domain CHASE-containing protein
MRVSSVLFGVAVLLLVQAAIVLGGVYFMLNVFGDELDSQLEREVTRVERRFEQDLSRIRREVRRDLRRELDSRLPVSPDAP